MLSTNTSALGNLCRVRTTRPTGLKAAAAGLVLPQVQQVINLVETGKPEAAIQAASSVTHAIGGAWGDVVCGPNPPRDFRRPVITETHTLSNAAVAAGANLQATLDAVANWLPLGVVAQRRFHQAANQPVAGAVMRPQIYGRTLIGISIEIRVAVQANPGGILAFPDMILSQGLTDLYYQYWVQIFPSASQEPLMDSTPVGVFKGGRMLLENLRTPVINENYRIEILTSFDPAAIGAPTALSGGPGVTGMTVDFNTVCGGVFAVSGCYIDGV